MMWLKKIFLVGNHSQSSNKNIPTGKSVVVDKIGSQKGQNLFEP